MGVVLDLTREEGARVLEEDLLLYNEAENIKELIKKFLDLKTPNKDRDIIEFFATNIFVSGGRGTGKTSILLTLEKELREEAENKCEILPIINLSVNYTGIIFYLLSYFKSKVEEEFKPTSCCSSSELWELLDKLINNFPKFLKCFCNNDCSYLCNEELEILLDQHEIKFLENFYKFLDEILDSKHLILILDDIDLIPDSKILLRTFLELAVFLNHPKIIIIGAGDIENLKIRLLKALKKNIGDNNRENPNDEKLYEEMVLALIDKIFPINNRIFLQKISPHILDKLKLKISADSGKEKEKDLKSL
jgi:Cdc6-like AAA superfamily ATPase